MVATAITDWNQPLLMQQAIRPLSAAPGLLSRQQIEDVIGPTQTASPIINDQTPNAFGQLSSHYAPKGKVRLNSTCSRNGSFFISFVPKMQIKWITISQQLATCLKLLQNLIFRFASGDGQVQIWHRCTHTLTGIGEAICVTITCSCLKIIASHVTKDNISLRPK